MERFNSEDTTQSNEELNENNHTKKPIITFYKLNRYFIIIFLCPIFCTLTNLFILLIYETEIIKKVEFVNSIFICIIYFLAGLFHFISFFRVNLNEEKESSSNNENSNSGINYIYNEAILNNFDTNKVILLILLLSLIVGIYCLNNNLIFGKNIFECRLYFFFFIPLFSKIILKENIYKHQYFSLIIAIIGIIFLLIPVSLVLGTDDIVPNILNFMTGILYSLFLVIIKYIIEKYYISPLKISLLF